ncbi:MAG TPA: ABC transporter permease [Gemmatimonadaceae bacterium]|nr:ABC transporter permease [Gemmatimonadaceae bacterium]
MRPSRFLPALGILAVLVALWWVSAIGSMIFPTPLAVLKAIGELLRTGTLMQHVYASLFRVTIGYLGALALAIPLGSMMGWFPRWFRAINPAVQMLRPISPIAWIPLAILWFGVGDASPTFLIFLATFFPVVVATASGVHMVEQQYVRAARNFGVNGFTLYRRVIFPAALPNIITGMRVGLGVAWLVVVAAEMVAINSGLGYLIIDARNAGSRYDLVVAGMVIIGLIGFGLDGVMRKLEHLEEVRWRYGT